MKITGIRITPLVGETPDTGWPRGALDNMYALVEVDTDEGVVGIGSCFTTAALAQASIQLLEPLLIGRCPLEPERLAETMHQTTHWFGRGGAVTVTISGVDIALWDILGKVTGQPVTRLLGGIYRDRIRVYASLLFAEPEILRRRLEAALEQGYTAIKLGWIGFGRRERAFDELAVSLARHVVGDDVDLMIDTGASEEFWHRGYHWAKETAHMLSAYGVRWFEEPLKPDDVAGHTRLRSSSGVAIATGESFTRRQQFAPFIESRAVDVLQPDTTKCGGLSEARRIAWAANDAGIEFVPHGWNTAVGLAADMALVAALPTADLVEYQVGSPYIDELSANPFEIGADGCVALPTGPGLGIELDRDALRRLSGGQ